ncbi:MAG: APC family permease [Sedimentisphaerales bacterium]|nr:APC family permease [Sedimentisphaerales bacterium]
MDDTNISLSKNKSEQSSKGLAWAKLFVALSLLMVVFIFALACNFYISESQSVFWGIIPYQLAIYILPLYFLGVAIRKVWAFYIAYIAVVCWTFLFLFLAVFIQHYLLFFDEELSSVPFIDFEIKFWQTFWLWALSVIFLFFGLIGSGKLLEGKYGRETPDRKKRKVISLPIVLVISAIFGLVMGVLLPALAVRRTRYPSDQMRCGSHLCALGIAMRSYSEQFDGTYPPADKWCDMLVEYCAASSEQFKCPQDRKNSCSFTFNPFCEPNSPPDMVLLFESAGGWNSSGGQELIQQRHQSRKGCNILFNDGHCAFIKTEDIPNLNWSRQH